MIVYEAVIQNQTLALGRWFSLGSLASSTSETDRRDMTEILLTVALNPSQSIKQTNQNLNIYNLCQIRLESFLDPNYFWPNKKDKAEMQCFIVFKWSSVINLHRWNRL